MKIAISNIQLNPDEPESKIEQILLQEFGLDGVNHTIIKKSLDARKKDRIIYTYRVVVDVDEKTAQRLLKHQHAVIYIEKKFPEPSQINKKLRVIIIGSGPAGLFSALRLIRGGADVDIFERGKSVDERMGDIRKLETEGVLDTESNVLFGEGGAGTYSDGKLTTRINRLEVNWFFDRLVEFGADPSVLIEAKPHLGTDNVRKIVRNIREFILSSGSTIHLNERVDDLIIKNNRIEGVRTSSDNEYLSSSVILAAGHSARDTYRLLHKCGVTMERKGFAAGLRIEHPSELIKNIQYGRSVYRDILPAADYNMAFNNPETGRGTYTFCMCPGGMIINSSSEVERLCLNGMSYSKRNSKFSNAAVIVSVNPGDTGDFIFSGIDFQARLEEKAFNSGGGQYRAPAQRALSFMKNRLDSDLPNSSYLPGIKAADLAEIIPAWMAGEIKGALKVFENRMRGFLSGEALLIGVETRSSSPLRVLREEDFQSVNVKGLYPAGEGSGYSGGIVSSAVDGIRAADSVLGSI